MYVIFSTSSHNGMAFSNSRIDRNEPENIVKHIINAIFEFTIVVKKLSL